MREEEMQVRNYPVVLLYHQVGIAPHALISRYALNIHPRVFACHMEVLSEEFDPIGLAEFIECQKCGTDVRKRIMVTFDDGYREAVQNAGEILGRFCLPNLWFINSALVDNTRVFWLSKLMWIADSGLLLDFIQIANNRWRGLLNPLENNGDILRWAKNNYSRTLENLINEYTWRFGFEEEEVACKARLFASREELKALASVKADIGNHTNSHPNICNLSLGDFQKEIETCDHMIEKIVGRKPDLFAFPFGEPGSHWKPGSVGILRDLGHSWIFSVEHPDFAVPSKYWSGVIPRFEVPVDLTEKSAFRAYVRKLLGR